MLFLGNPLVFSQSELRDAVGNVYYDRNLYDQDYDYKEGSPYLYPEFVPARIDAIAKTQLIRFDAFQGRVELMADAGRNLVLPADRSFEIRLLDGSDRLFRTHSYTGPKGEEKNSFFEVLAETDQYVLYKREDVAFRKEKKAEGYSPYRPARFEATGPVFYLMDQEGNLRELPTRNKDFIRFFEKEDQVREYLKANRPDLESAEDLRAFLRVYYQAAP